jgi:hypothetical protein
MHWERKSREAREEGVHSKRELRCGGPTAVNMNQGGRRRGTDIVREGRS